ncbi:uncharacterized protein LOC126669842 [Mercurialis annua]|uniref:uncharacterized protein LOC126669842 n=1 Tax=Mercurialis annua TaxID=3986 RepID=UPI00215E3F9A|nr:uncharacterized protein LOC126669842 [Mercurialis annua]
MASLKWLINSAFTQVFGHADTATTSSFTVSVHQECLNNNLKDARIAKKKFGEYPNGFQLPLHYPKFSKADYEKMEEWRVDMLLNEYGLCFKGTLNEKRAFAMGSFLWPDQI